MIAMGGWKKGKMKNAFGMVPNLTTIFTTTSEEYSRGHWSLRQGIAQLVAKVGDPGLGMKL